MKKFILLSLLALMLSSAYAEYQADVYFFWGESCGYCAKEKPFLESLQLDYPQINLKSYEVWKNSTNRDYFFKTAEDLGMDTSKLGVPVTIIGDKHWIGYSSTDDSAIIVQIEKCINEGGCGEFYTNSNETLCLHAFLTLECRQCQAINQTFSMLEEKYNISIKIHDYPQEKELYDEFKETYGIISAGFPIVFLGDYYLAGDSAIYNNLESLVAKCINESCICPIQNIEAYTSNLPSSGSMTPEEEFLINIPFIGEIDLTNMSLYLVTLIIAFMDGANPCSLWMISFLLGIVIYTGSRKKILLIGLTFLTTTTTIYGIFLMGLINALYYIGFIFWIRLLIGLMALIFALVNIKDYFYYKKGISFTISDEAKPTLFKKIRNIMNPENSLKAIIIGTILLALSVTLVELPCTAGLPMLWTSFLARNNVTGLNFLIHLLIYLLVFLIDELVLVLIAAYTLKVTNFEEKHGRILKLFGGVIMASLGISMILMPELMDDFVNVFIMFIGSILLTSVINYIFNNFKIEKRTKKEKEELEEESEVKKLIVKKNIKTKKKSKKSKKKKSEKK
jgi:glutaredoxin